MRNKAKVGSPFYIESGDSIELISTLRDRCEELNYHIGTQNKVIKRKDQLINSFTYPLENSGFDVKALLKLSEMLKVDVYKLLDTKYSTVWVHSFLSKTNLMPNFCNGKTSRWIGVFSEKYGLLENEFFVKRISRTSYGKKNKNYTTLLFSLLGVVELLRLCRKKEEGDEGYLETYYLMSNKKNKEKLLKALENIKQKSVVEYDIKNKVFID